MVTIEVISLIRSPAMSRQMFRSWECWNHSCITIVYQGKIQTPITSHLPLTTLQSAFHVTEPCHRDHRGPKATSEETRRSLKWATGPVSTPAQRQPWEANGTLVPSLSGGAFICMQYFPPWLGVVIPAESLAQSQLRTCLVQAKSLAIKTYEMGFKLKCLTGFCYSIHHGSTPWVLKGATTSDAKAASCLHSSPHSKLW